MNHVQQERARCAKLVKSLMSRNKDNMLLNDKLKELLRKIENPPVPAPTGARGGLLTEQLELPFGN